LKYLLDTSVFLWMAGFVQRLNLQARELLAERSAEVYLSSASSWEIAIKSALGKLDLPEPPPQYVLRRLADFSIRSLPITHDHSFATGSLPHFHDDPFDRMLIAQASVEGMVVLTADKVFRRYPVEVLWAGK
jgi:PIN domain nuclease of toxin-antitoxin system